jgi:hypothetical protein
VDAQGFVGIAFLLAMLIVVGLARRRSQGGTGTRRRRAGGVGSAAMGSVYDLLNEDKRRAIEIIVEEKAEERRPEYPDGDLPQLENPTAPKRR